MFVALILAGFFLVDAALLIFFLTRSSKRRTPETKTRWGLPAKNPRRAILEHEKSNNMETTGRSEYGSFRQLCDTLDEHQLFLVMNREIDN